MNRDRNKSMGDKLSTETRDSVFRNLSEVVPIIILCFLILVAKYNRGIVTF